MDCEADASGAISYCPGIAIIGHCFAHYQGHANNRPSAVSRGYAIGSRMAAIGAHVGAKLGCVVAWVHLHKFYYHRP